jgi:hypothetical protein
MGHELLAPSSFGNDASSACRHELRTSSAG